MTTPTPLRPRSDAGAARRPLFQHPWRIVVVAVGLLAVANLGLVLLSNADTTETTRVGLPSAIDDLAPHPGDLIGPQDTVLVDLRDDLTGVLLVDRAEVPEDQLDRVPSLGQLSFRPGPDKDLGRWSPGEHTAVILYWEQGKDRPAHPSSFSWTFRVGA